jgi:methylated-DNA-[protein]-cysteine S-methyltransferase
MIYARHESPVGPLLLAGDGVALKVIGFSEGKGRVDRDPRWRRDPRALAEAARQLDEYFAGTRRAFDLRLAPSGTPFQLSVWRELQTIPYGDTWSYRDLAIALGNGLAVRAVGLANGRNPIPIVVPCHRVIGSDGSLTGFGGGLEAKRYLLDLERRVAHPAAQQLDLLATPE